MKIIYTRDGVWILVCDIDVNLGWYWLGYAEFWEMLDAIDWLANDQDIGMDAFDTWNIYMLVNQDRRFKRFAREVEGR